MMLRSLTFWVVTLFSSIACQNATADSEVSTLEIARRVRDKGLQEHPLQRYCGVLLMQGMAELAVASGNYDDLEAARKVLLPFATGKSTMGGNFARYRCGGNGASFLLMHGHMPEGRKEILSAAIQTIRDSRASPEGLVLASGMPQDPIECSSTRRFLSLLSCCGPPSP